VARNKPGRPLKGNLKEVDEALKQWGEETGGDERVIESVSGWPSESLLSRLIREGPDGAGQQGTQRAPLSDKSAAVDLAVQTLRSDVKKAVRAWYRSASRGNRTMCLRALRIHARQFSRLLKRGRALVADVLGIGSSIPLFDRADESSQEDDRDDLRVA
jgi:hypothetical protein